MKKFNTLSEAMNTLKSKGYNLEFNLAHGCIYCIGKALNFHPYELNIIEVYKGGQKENAVVYSVESQEHGIKGILVNSF